VVICGGDIDKIENIPNEVLKNTCTSMYFASIFNDSCKHYQKYHQKLFNLDELKLLCDSSLSHQRSVI